MMRRLRYIAGLGTTIVLIAGMAMSFTNCALKESQTGTASVLGAEFSGRVSGELTVIEKSGLVMGYAYDAKNPDKKMMVHFVVDGPESTGTYIGNVVANVTSAGIFSGYYYNFQIPAEYAGSAQHSLYVYGHEVKAANRLFQSPQNFTILVPKAEAVFISSGLRDYVNSSCNGCHGWNYRDLFYGPLGTPSPFANGSPTNNALILKINGSSSHGGGQRCTSNNVMPCSAIQQWWTAEFR